jgi:hypothetical protein
LFANAEIDPSLISLPIRGENTYRTTSAAKIEIDGNSFVAPDFDRSPENMKMGLFESAAKLRRNKGLVAFSAETKAPSERVSQFVTFRSQINRCRCSGKFSFAFDEDRIACSSSTACLSSKRSSNS